MSKILLLPGDGIGPEIMNEALKVLSAVDQKFNLNLTFDEGLIGGASIDAHGVSLTDDTLRSAQNATAVLLGAVGGPKWDNVARDIRPETGLLKLRAGCEAFANLRPALTYAPLAAASSLKSELVAGLDILIVRELTGGIYFGQPREIAADKKSAFNTMVYSNTEIERIARVAFELAQKRDGRLCSVEKANVLEVSQLWREVVIEVAKDYPDVELLHMYVDNAAMQLVRAPKQFDVIVTGNLFGDILSDIAAMLTGSIGMLPSASLNSDNHGIYEPVHGSAPDIAGTGKANPLAMILSASMMLRYTCKAAEAADAIDAAVIKVLESGARTADIADDPSQAISTQQMGEAVLAAL